MIGFQVPVVQSNRLHPSLCLEKKPLLLRAFQRANGISIQKKAAIMTTMSSKPIPLSRDSMDKISAEPQSVSLLPRPTIDIIKATVPVLEDKKFEIVANFYNILFSRYPFLKAQFNMDRQVGGASTDDGIPTQVRALGNSVLAYAKNIENVEKIMPRMEGIFHKHVSRGVTAEQYSYIGECLLAAIKETLGTAATDEIISAWGDAYHALAQAFIASETDLAKQLSQRAGYSEMANLRIVSKRHNTEKNVFEVDFESVDGSVPKYDNGQFVSIDVPMENGDHMMTSFNLLENNLNVLTAQFKVSNEIATIHIMNSLEGDVFKVSVPCGRGKKDSN